MTVEASLDRYRKMRGQAPADEYLEAALMHERQATDAFTASPRTPYNLPMAVRPPMRYPGRGFVHFSY